MTKMIPRFMRYKMPNKICDDSNQEPISISKDDEKSMERGYTTTFQEKLHWRTCFDFPINPNLGVKSCEWMKYLSWINFSTSNIADCRINVQKPSWIDQWPCVTFQVHVISFTAQKPTDLCRSKIYIFIYIYIWKIYFFFLGW